MSTYFRIASSFCSTSTVVSWTAERGGLDVSYGQNDWDGWVPADDIRYESGQNTWSASGAISNESIRKLKKFWIAVAPKASLKERHVLGKPYTQPWVDTVVDQAFVDAVSKFDDTLFSFVEFERAWDHTHQCPPWDGPFYVATVLPFLASYDMEASDLVPASQSADRFRGRHGSTGSRRVLRADVVNNLHLWRDTYTREVFCSGEMKKLLDDLGVSEWAYYPISAN